MLRFLTLLVLMGWVTACGFHPRGGLPDNVKDKTIAMTGIGSNVNLYNRFVKQLITAGGKFTDKTANAAAVVNILKQRHIRRPIALSAVGRANMFDLNYLVVYEVHDTKGHIISKAKELMVRREYFNTQASPLSQGNEEQTYRSEMEAEAATILLRQVILAIENPPEVPYEKGSEDNKTQTPEPLVNGSMQP